MATATKDNKKQPQKTADEAMACMENELNARIQRIQTYRRAMKAMDIPSFPLSLTRFDRLVEELDAVFDKIPLNFRRAKYGDV